MRESYIEARLVAGVEAAGGMCEKFTSPGRRHVPDRLVTWPGGVMELVELKAPGKKPRPGQARDHFRRWLRGVSVIVLDSIAQVDNYLRRGNP